MTHFTRFLTAAIGAFVLSTAVIAAAASPAGTALHQPVSAQVQA